LGAAPLPFRRLSLEISSISRGSTALLAKFYRFVTIQVNDLFLEWSRISLEKMALGHYFFFCKFFFRMLPLKLALLVLFELKYRKKVA